MRTYCTRNGSCVGSNIGWSVSIPIQELTVGYRLASSLAHAKNGLVKDRQNAEGSTDSAVYG